ncbi:TRAP transporter small permease [Salipiger sp. P9]|uniref:TRAP transporter small permease subunit n=1 Tax=Salipiger pentaromativorans TaxID=2943193 RepID=UPI0021582C23|nr:TRAP transporter small permease [Salipiger pentaromativorans]MCR8549253.1 TRAP transporter small permease [Salipiger pentaromativorans]
MTRARPTPHALDRIILASDRWLRQAEAALLAVACVALLMIMGLISADALSRYLLNKPLTFTYDLVIMYLLPAAMFFVVPYALRAGEHVTLDILAHNLPRRLRHLALGIGFLVALPLFVLIANEMWIKTHESWVSGLRSAAQIAWPIWVKSAVILVSFAVISVRVLHFAVANLSAAVSARPVWGDHLSAVTEAPDAAGPQPHPGEK